MYLISTSILLVQLFTCLSTYFCRVLRGCGKGRCSCFFFFSIVLCRSFENTHFGRRVSSQMAPDLDPLQTRASPQLKIGSTVPVNRTFFLKYIPMTKINALSYFFTGSFVVHSGDHLRSRISNGAILGDFQSKTISGSLWR